MVQTYRVQPDGLLETPIGDRHHVVRVEYATKDQPCGRCGKPIQRGEMVEVDREVRAAVHPSCGIRARRAQ
jgi:hypothetical protein